MTALESVTPSNPPTATPTDNDLTGADISITDITLCDDCDGMYDLCSDHRPYAFDRGYAAVLDDAVEPADLPRDPERYHLTKHCVTRQRQRRIPTAEIDEAIENGRCTRTPVEHRFKFLRRFAAWPERSKQPRELTVIVQVDPAAVAPETPTTPVVVTAYYSQFVESIDDFEVDDDTTDRTQDHTHLQ